MDWLIEDISATLTSWGHTGGPECELIVKSDGEPAIVAVRDAVMKYHGGIMIPENLADGEQAENGLLEEAGKTIREYVCTFLSQIEDGANKKLPLDSNLHLWIARWADMCYSSYAVGKAGRAAYERLCGRTVER